MELFSVTCITCRSRLKVRHESAIGQILACPKCIGMVEIKAPPGWKPPAKAASAPSSKPAATTTEPLATAVPASPAADDGPLLPPGQIVAPHEAQARRWILIGGGLLSLLIIAFGLWATFGRREALPPEREPEPLAAATTTPTASRTPSPSPSASKPALSATALAGVSATAPLATVSATPSATSPVVLASASPTIPIPAITPTPSPTAAPSSSIRIVTATPTTTAVPTAAPSPTAIASATKPPPAVPRATTPAAPPPQIDLAARLQDKLPEIDFDKVPLRRALDLVAQLSTIRVAYDADSLAPDAALLATPVTLKLSDALVQEVFAQLLAAAELQGPPVGDQLFLYRDAPWNAEVEETYVVDDLTSGDPQAVGLLGDRLRLLTGPATVTQDGSKLVVQQTVAGRREAKRLLDRLRLTRGKAPQDSQASLETRLHRSTDLLSKPVTMNFRPGATLAEIVARFEAETGATVLVDSIALAAQGFAGPERIGISADKHPAAVVLNALCEPRDWGWRLVGPKLIEITTREAARRRSYVEFYALPSSSPTETDGPSWVTRIQTQLADELWADAGAAEADGAGAIVFDDASRRLIVRQHQAAHARIERLLAETTKSPPAAPAPRPTPTPTASRPISAVPASSPSATPR